MSKHARYSLIEEAQPVNVPFWREALTGVDWARLRLSPVFYGLGAPRGDRSAVIAVPGFMGSDLYLSELRYWLRRIGYRSYPSGIGRNWDCLQVSGEKLIATIEKAHKATGRPVHLIGHSLGGLLSRSVAGMVPESVASVITLGSPIQAINAHPYVINMSDVIRESIRARGGAAGAREHCFSGKCTCSVVCNAREPRLDDVPHLAIYTKTDGVVHWEACMNEDPATNYEVHGTHCGLAFNPDVFKKIAGFLKTVPMPKALPATVTARPVAPRKKPDPRVVTRPTASGHLASRARAAHIRAAQA